MQSISFFLYHDNKSNNDENEVFDIFDSESHHE